MVGRKKFEFLVDELGKVKAKVESYRLQAMAFYRRMGGRYDMPVTT